MPTVASNGVAYSIVDEKNKDPFEIKHLVDEGLNEIEETSSCTRAPAKCTSWARSVMRDLVVTAATACPPGSSKNKAVQEAPPEERHPIQALDWETVVLEDVELQSPEEDLSPSEACRASLEQDGSRVPLAAKLRVSARAR